MKCWILERTVEGKTEETYRNRNYYTFCGKVRAILDDADKTAIDELRKSLDTSFYCDENKARFRDAHNSVKSSFKVYCEETTEDGNVSDKIENEKVMSYLWSIKGGKKS